MWLCFKTECDSECDTECDSECDTECDSVSKHSMSFEATLFFPSDTETIFKECKLSAFKEAHKRLPTKLKFKKKSFS